MEFYLACELGVKVKPHVNLRKVVCSFAKEVFFLMARAEVL
jgi:hypothetical protein